MQDRYSAIDCYPPSDRLHPQNRKFAGGEVQYRDPKRQLACPAESFECNLVSEETIEPNALGLNEFSIRLR